MKYNILSKRGEKIEEEQETYSYIFCTYNNYIYDMGYFSTS